MVIDDLRYPHPLATNGAAWRLFTDRVMGGVSDGTLQRETLDGRPALRLRGDVRLDNNGGFVQMALDIRPDGRPSDLSGFAGIALTVRGNGTAYGLHLKTGDTERPWQSYRHGFEAGPAWQTLHLAFGGFRPHRVDRPFDPGSVRRLGLVAIGRAFAADLALAGAALYTEA